MTQHLDPLHNKRVAIMGFARQGRALARWLPTVGAIPVVSDSKNAEQLKINPADFPQVEFIFNDSQAQLPPNIDVLCVSGGVPLETPMIRDAVEKGVRITNDAQLFLERSPAPVLGITGSAGKTTTTTLTGEVMRRAGYTTYVGGNIGDVLLDVLPQITADDRVVMELSSFQLEIMTVSPQYAMVLNITPNHLDRHGTMEAYTAAKANLILNQTEADVAVLSKDDAGSRGLEDSVVGRLVSFSMREMVADGAFMAGERLIVAGDSSPDGSPTVICERKDILLRGDHNVLNVLAACALTGAAGVRPEVMLDVIRGFKGVAHRQEIVRVKDGVTYVNDTIATAPERVLAALRSYHEPLVLLLGGKDKDLPWEEMLGVALGKARHIITFGHAGEMIARKIREVYGARDNVTQVETLEDAVSKAAAVTQPGDVVLLSPGGTSYDAYVDFAARGEHFRKLVGEL
ncbi:MAG: UDP-N-acetylmuramoyl-L-alanine--D-glutamate ligase [Anaerolineae bacterium]